MRLSLIAFPLFLLTLLPAAADWERLRPKTEPPPVIQPVSDAVCREKARSIEERIRPAEISPDGTGAAAGTSISVDTWNDWRWFMRRCFYPRLCPAAQAVPPRLRDFTVTPAYEELIRLCGQQDGQL